MEQLEINRNACSNHERNLLVYLMDIKPLENDQCYMIVSSPFNIFCLNKIQTLKYKKIMKILLLKNVN